MRKPIFINSNKRTQLALARVEALADFLGISKSQAAVQLIQAAPEPIEKKRLSGDKGGKA